MSFLLWYLSGFILATIACWGFGGKDLFRFESDWPLIAVIALAGPILMPIAAIWGGLRLYYGDK